MILNVTVRKGANIEVTQRGIASEAHNITSINVNPKHALTNNFGKVVSFPVCELAKVAKDVDSRG